MPRLDFLNNYIVGKYALPNSLRAVKIIKDPSVTELKKKLEVWHADKIKGLVGWNANQQPID